MLLGQLILILSIASCVARRDLLSCRLWMEAVTGVEFEAVGAGVAEVVVGCGLVEVESPCSPVVHF